MQKVLITTIKNPQHSPVTPETIAMDKPDGKEPKCDDDDQYRPTENDPLTDMVTTVLKTKQEETSNQVYGKSFVFSWSVLSY